MKAEKPKPKEAPQQFEDLIGPENFVAHQLLGTGSFGEVFLVERKTDKQLLAMKVLSKKRVKQ
jgi:serine/threonine protein kinase